MINAQRKLKILCSYILCYYNLPFDSFSGKPSIEKPPINNLNRLGMQKCKNLKDFQLKLHRESQKEYRQ